MSKKPRSFSLDEDIAEILSERNDINPSGIVNDFLRQYISGDKGKEAALEVRMSELDEQIAELEKEKERKERERKRIKAQLESRRGELYEKAEEMAQMIEDGDFFIDNLNADNGAVKTYAAKADVPAEQFVDEVESRINND